MVIKNTHVFLCLLLWKVDDDKKDLQTTRVVVKNVKSFLTVYLLFRGDGERVF